MYTAQDRRKDFEFYREHLADFYRELGVCWIALRNGEVLGTYANPADAVHALKSHFSFGEYSIQRCDKDESAYTIKLTGVRFGA